MNKEQTKEFNIFKNRSYEIAKADDCAGILQILEEFHTKYGNRKPPIDWLAFIMRYNIKSGHTNVLKLILERYYHDVDNELFIYNPYKYAIKYKNKDAMLILESIGLINYDSGLILAKSVFDKNEFIEFFKRVTDRAMFNDGDTRPEKLVDVADIDTLNVRCSLHVYSDEMCDKFCRYNDLNKNYKKVKMHNNKTINRLFYSSVADRFSNKADNIFDCISLVDIRNIVFINRIRIDYYSSDQLEAVSNIRKLNKPSRKGLF